MYSLPWYTGRCKSGSDKKSAHLIKLSFLRIDPKIALLMSFHYNAVVIVCEKQYYLTQVPYEVVALMITLSGRDI